MALLLTGLLAAPAAAHPSRGIDLACPNPTPNAFTDDDGNVHESSINCMARWEIANGTTAGSYRPESTVRRDQTASFVERLMSTGGFVFDGNPVDQFDDDNGSVHERSINKLAAAGVVRGTGERTYGPATTMTRGQMAALLNRALQTMEHGADASHAHFTDVDGSVFEQDIDRLATLGVVEGTGDGLFSPTRSVERAAMASFLARTADRLAERGAWPTARGPVRAPTEFVAEPGDGATVALSWTPPEDIRVDFYFLQTAISPPGVTCETPRFYGFAEVLPGRATAGHQHDGQSGVTYCYRLRAVHQEGRFQTDSPPVFAGPVTAR